MQALIKIIDETENINRNVLYKFKKISTYNRLLKDLPIIYPEFNSKPSKIIVSFTYRGKNEIVDDYNKYIINGDKIELKIVETSPLYFLIDVLSYNKLKTSYCIKDLYKLFITQYQNNVDCEILLVKQFGNTMTLIDVLDTPLRHHNECINRLIHEYNF